MKNIEVEIQVFIKNLAMAESRLKEVGKFIKSRQQIDKYYVLPHRDFFAKDMPDEYLRIRFEEDKNHLNYSFLHFTDDGWLRSTDEYETLVDKPEVVEEIFEKINLILKVTVEKTRKYFDCGDFEVTLDNIKGLGDFMEVEAKKDFGGIDKTRNACEDFLRNLNVEYEIQKEMGYPRMLYKKLKEQSS
jgi:adenylate cyclase, class 2